MTVVYVDMVADLYHAGHVEFLRRARQIGDILVVGIHDDTTVASYKRTPIIPHDQREAVVASCRYVDRVVPCAPLIVTDAFMDQHGIDIVAHAHGEEDEERYRAMYAAPARRGRFRRLAYTPGVSTTQILQAVRQRGPD